MVQSGDGLHGCSLSPSLRGSGLKFAMTSKRCHFLRVSLFTREWIEMVQSLRVARVLYVSLFTREWIEIVDLVAMT